MQRLGLIFTFIALSLFPLNAAHSLAAGLPGRTSILIGKGGEEVRLETPGLARTLHISKTGVASTSLRSGATELLAGPSHEFRLEFQFASPNRKPQGLKPGEGAVIDSS